MGELVPKPWGGYQTAFQGEKYWVKRLVIAPLSRLSLQSHEHRYETWVCTKGECIAVVDGVRYYMAPGVRVSIPTGSKHRIENTSKEKAEVIEIAIGEILSEEDITRYADDYGRADNHKE